MQISTIIIITLLIVALYIYTAERFDVVETVGKYVGNFMKDVITGRYIKEPSKDQKREIIGIADIIKDKIRDMLYNIRRYAED